MCVRGNVDLIRNAYKMNEFVCVCARVLDVSLTFESGNRRVLLEFFGALSH